jgi:hypothetical protein
MRAGVVLKRRRGGDSPPRGSRYFFPPPPCPLQRGHIRFDIEASFIDLPFERYSHGAGESLA